HLDQFHDRRGVEEVHPHHAVRALRRVRHLRDAQGRRIRGEHDLGRAEAVEFGVELLLHLHLLEDRLDDDLRPRDGLLQVDGPADVKPAFIRDCGRLISPPLYARGRGAPMQRPPRSLVLALAIVFALASIVAIAPRAAAAQNRPSWTQGDFWVYARTAGSATSTVRVDVNE